MASHVVLGTTSKLKWVHTGDREVIYAGRHGHCRSIIEGLICCSKFIRLSTQKHGEDSSRSHHGREGRQAALDQAARTHLQDGSTLKEAVIKLVDRANQGFFGNSYAYNHVLKWCSKEKDLESVNQVHESVKDSQMEQDPYVANMLLKCYIECGRLETAQELFNKLLKKDTVTWNMMIAGCAKLEQAEDAIETYKQMRNEGGEPNAITYLSVLKACASPTAFKWRKDIHAHIISDGLQADARVANALVHMYAKTGLIADAKEVFDKMRIRNVISWNVMIGGLAELGLGHEAFSMFLEMQREGVAPDSITYLNILNPCSSAGAEEWLKKVHAHALEAGLEKDGRVANAFVQMYAKTGLIADAKQVFDEIQSRNVINWNVMIGGLAEQGLGREAFSMFLRMQRDGISPNVITYLSILNPCSSAGAEEWLEEVHAHAFEAGLAVNVRVGTALVQMYAKTGLIADAKEVFDKMLIRNVITWNVMIGGLAEQGLGHEAFSMFLRMQREGIAPNAITYLSILNPSSSAGAEEWLKKVHAQALEAGLLDDGRVANAFVQMYAKTGLIADAKLVFDKMQTRNTISWTVMIGGLAEQGFGHEAFSMFLRMQREGIAPNVITYLSILNPSSSAGAEEWLKKVHARALEAGLDVDVRVGTALVQMYTKTGLIADAKQVFEKMQIRDVFAWNMMISGLAEQGLGHEAFSLFLQMQREGISPDANTYVSILNSCSSAGAEEWLSEVHAHALEAGLDVDVRVGTALVQLYAKTGLIAVAKQVFDKMQIRDVFSWNVMIGGLAEQGLGHEAFSLFLRMQTVGIVPNGITYVSILNPCSSAGAAEWLKEVHAHSMDAGLDVDVRVGTALVQMYAKTGLIADAKQVFDKMLIRDVFCWNVMIGGLAEQGLGHEAFSMFLRMQREGMAPDAITYVSILNPCSSAGSEEWLKEVHAHALQAGLHDDVGVGNALVHMYAKTGLIADAEQVFDKMRIRDVISWNVMIGGLAQHGNGRKALQLFEKMESEGVKPDDVSFVAVLSACNHAGLVEEGLSLFDSMMRDHGVEPNLSHYNCVVDMVGRAGRLKEAQLFILNMPVKPNIVTWKAFLSACRIHQNVKLAELAATECMKLRPTDAPANVLLSNVYASEGNWDQVSSIRRMMQERGIRKDPGRCSVEVGNKVHDFVVGDSSHPETREIYIMLSSLSEKLKAEGYIPDTRLVLRNIAEEDKESAICSHSEKLAIAYGLMHVPPGKPIRVYKNLRICTDCHAATKLISKTTEREIVARDANRFHHFKGGSCSCGDYW